MPAEDLEVIEGQGRRIIECAQGAPEAMVPQYPTWTLLDLASHVAGVHGRTAVVCETLATERVPVPERPPDADALEWAREQLERMIAGLRTADPEAEVWTFVSERRLRFWSRRMVVETGVHRWDADGAIGDPRALLPEVAGYGLDEFGDLYLPRLGDVPGIELVATDLGRSWRFGTAEPVARIEDSASALYLRLMQRPGASLPEPWARAVDSLGTPVDR
jgi:uncharacterized protein (TIGR03083 family)